MSISYIVACKSTQGVISTGVQYATVEDALRSLESLLPNSTSAMSIIDSEAHLILPADQVRLRLQPKGNHTPAGSHQPAAY